MPDGCHPVPGVGPHDAKIVIVGDRDNPYSKEMHEYVSELDNEIKKRERMKLAQGFSWESRFEKLRLEINKNIL